MTEKAFQWSLSGASSLSEKDSDFDYGTPEALDLDAFVILDWRNHRPGLHSQALCVEDWKPCSGQVTCQLASDTPSLIEVSPPQREGGESLCPDHTPQVPRTHIQLSVPSIWEARSMTTWEAGPLSGRHMKEDCPQGHPIMGTLGPSEQSKGR